ncbi:APA family basic amino acid/polyamine antiporter [Clostridium acetobutylicum]|uniref:Predicted amino acid transporter n=1 Tax=Clostridium acetobutylicum (strain ATCC 824 / DSM 792 / JCM 1419 / IAM 19013 / LMG 5710 / NBRC 13948 / NRRL B-527 / VKM B-1787 / 2291 / W) TaxID=272562 RepID=Q97E31_CLOAB|nr:MULTISPECIES: amino acid permease [Clostridium]AAK81219.1 Predicted amino acid transporter [Clostridium acetobutylicum ATCC 824]ADZ22324.1 amino acid transporter [Clostridium acetobutylicum EA 2018]AEI32749.1 amino acid transporter [Clostridium acetobutylicum DSM 1731]AWV81113.1 amino acid permease [Clostridium acetobutylicum]KHD34335.1 amino acid permease [Clostridium acetobutylicum]
MEIFRKKTAEDFQDEASSSNLKRGLTSFDLAAIGIGAVVGTGIFVSTGQGAKLAGPSVVISFLVAAVTCGLCSLTYCELSSMFSVSGSTYSYSYIAFGEIIAWIIGWDLMLEYLVAASAISSGWSSTLIGIVKNYGVNVPDALTKSPLSGGIVDLPAIFITLVITFLLYRGVTESAKINNVIVGVKICIIALFVFLGITHVKVTNYHPFVPYGVNGIMSAAAIIFFSFIGFDAIATTAEETKDPKKDVPKGLLICFGVVVVLYMSVAIILTGIVPYTKIDINNALPGALSSIGITWGSALVGVGAVLGMISTLLVIMYGQIRIFMVMSRDGLLPKVFSSVNKKHSTPGLCTVITGVLVSIIAGFLPLKMIMELCNIGTLFAFILVSFGVIVLRYTMPNVERKFKCPGVPFTPLVTAFFCFYMMIHLPLFTWLRFGAWLLIGFVIYFVYGSKHSKMTARDRGKEEVS